MTGTDLRAFLDDAAGEPPLRLHGPAIRELAARPARRHARLLPLVAAAAVAALALVVPQLVTRPGGTATGVPDGALRLNGVAVVLPQGWTTGKSLCGQQRPRTVALQPDLDAMSCPDLPAVYTGPWITVRPVHLDQIAYTWTGDRTLWKEQQAFRSVRAGKAGVLVTVTLPALNAQVSAAAPDQAQADALLDDAVLVAPQPQVDADEWSTIHLLALQDTKGERRTRTAATLTGPQATELLDALAAAPPSDANVCTADWDGGTVLLRLDSAQGDHRDLAVRTDAPCAQVFTGGQLRSVTPELRQLLEDTLTDPTTAPPAVAAAAARALAAAPAGTRIVWVRTTWGRWRALEGQDGGPDAAADVYVVQALSPVSYSCPGCKGLAQVTGRVSTSVLPVRGASPNDFVFGELDFGVPELPGVRTIRVRPG